MKIKDFIDYEQPNEYIVESDRYSSKYSTPVLTAGQSFILGYTNESKGIYKKGPCIIFDDFTTSVHYVDFPFKVKSSAMKILTAKNNADLKYCYYLLLSLSKMPPNHKRQWISTTSEKNHLLPSTDKQISIVKQLDLISDNIANYTNQIENLDNLVKARFVEMFGDPQTNQFNWNKVNISRIIKGEVSNGYFAKRNEYCDNGNVNILGVANIVNRMYSNVKDLPKTNANQKDIAKFKVQYGDMLFCRSSLVAEGIGKASIIPKDIADNILFECHVIRLPLDLNQCVPEFLQVLSTTDFFRNQVIAQSKTATMTTIGQDGILKTNIILPPIYKQKEFESFVQQVDKSKLAVQQSLEKTQLLFDSLMQEYFGEN